MLHFSGGESHNSFGSAGWYHQPWRREISVVRLVLRSVYLEGALEMALKGMNDTKAPDGLVPTFRLFGSFSSFVTTASDLPIRGIHMAALRTTREEMAL